ncbi:MAG: hypothetical protein F4Z95_02920 [Gammaproteobacteria bacterium]|nr:hypothetical protein [Gammaproteobacteria bacterium]
MKPLQRPSPPRNCYSAGDVLAVAVIRTITKDFSIRVGALTTVADDLIKTCNDHSWLVLERSQLVIFLSEETIEVHPEEARIQFRASALVVLLRPLAARIREVLLADHGAAEQGMFPFPPAARPTGAPALSRRHQS